MRQDLNATIAQASLDNLYDILPPEPIGFFPLAPGWWMVFFLLLTLLFHFVWQQYLRYKKNLYKREALEELSTLQTSNNANTLALLELPKRTAISAYSRAEVATLNDDLWWDFMQRESKVKVDASLRESLLAFLTHEKVLSQSEYRSLYALVEQWIQTHKGGSND